MFENLIGKKNFSIDRLATLCHIAEAGSIGAATGGNANQQSQYSRQITELSQFLGIPLLDRHSKPHKLTEEAEELSRISQGYLSAIDDFVGRCKGQPSRLVIGAGESLIQWLLIPGVLPSLRERLPGVMPIFKNLQSESILEALRVGELDLAFVRKDAVPKEFSTSGKFDIQYRLFVPRKLRIKLKDPVTFPDIAEIPMAVLEGSGQLRSLIEQESSSSHVKLNTVIECSSVTQLALLVSRKDCCAILPSIARNQFDETIDEYCVKDFTGIVRSLTFTWNPKRSQFRPIIEEAAKICSIA